MSATALRPTGRSDLTGRNPQPTSRRRSGTATRARRPPRAEPAGWPRLPREIVARPRLYAALDAGVASSALTLVSAPAAAGKTVLLASWMAKHAGARAAWIDLRRAKRRPLVLGIGDALREALPDDVRLRHLDEEESAGSGTPLVDRLLEVLQGETEPVVVVLDGLMALTADDLATLDDILRAAPRSLRIVAASRYDPPLALHLLRVAGDLAEVRADDLAFTIGEAHELYARIGLELTDREIAEVVERTEGWAGGLALFGLSLRRHRDDDRAVERFALDERPITEYLAAEVLAAQPADVRDFLLRTSILETLDAELVDAVTGRRDGSRTLHALHNNNAFVELLDETEPLYRFHTLFSELLRVEAAAELGAELPELHARAARCLAERGRVVEAVEHAVAAEQWELVGELVERHWDVIYGAGAVSSVKPLIERVPRRRAAASPSLAAFASLLRFLSGDARPAAVLVDRAKARAPEDAVATAPLLRYVEILAARTRGDVAAAAALATEQIERASVEAADSNGEDRLRALALSALGTARIWQLEPEDAQLALEEAVDLARAAAVAPAEADALVHLGLIELMLGRLRRADRMARVVLELAELHGWGDTPWTTVARVVVASAEYQWGDLDAAEESAALADAGASRTGDVLGRALATSVSAAVAASRGGDHADEALVHLRATRRRMPAAAGALLGGRLVGLEARMLAATARLDEALEVVAAGDQDDPFVAVPTARIRLAKGEPDRALAVLAGRGVTSPWAEVDARVTEAIALDATSDHAGALVAVGDALALAETEEVRRPFLDAGPAVRGLLGEHLRHTNEHRWLASELLRRIDGREAESTGPAELLEPLSDREREVLRFLRTAMSNGDIAAELFVSVNTVKTHVKSIYRKLDVTRRYDAVQRARRLRLL